MRRFSEVEEYIDTLKTANKQLKSLIKRNKKLHMEEQLNCAGNNERKKWEIIKGAIHLGKNKSSIDQTTLEDNNLIEESKEIANTMNRHFIDRVKKTIIPKNLEENKNN
ncbi:hypothetical protein HHI36_009802 [Cryptolaemus montrouzieri]|uniref:Uncharacterized protein n=1 Tax=Cryptolaemus montrouzieri TaxID=559131 RepID=A0ABD2MGU9_9CUCU